MANNAFSRVFHGHVSMVPWFRIENADLDFIIDSSGLDFSDDLRKRLRRVIDEYAATIGLQNTAPGPREVRKARQRHKSSPYAKRVFKSMQLFGDPIPKPEPGAPRNDMLPTFLSGLASIYKDAGGVTNIRRRFPAGVSKNRQKQIIGDNDGFFDPITGSLTTPFGSFLENVNSMLPNHAAWDSGGHLWAAYKQLRNPNSSGTVLFLREMYYPHALEIISNYLNQRAASKSSRPSKRQIKLRRCHFSNRRINTRANLKGSLKWAWKSKRRAL